MLIRPLASITMRYLLIMFFGLILAVTGCNRPAAQAASGSSSSTSDQLIASGELISVTLWKAPVQRPGETGSNSGDSPPKGSRVQIYPNFILVTDPSGNTQLSLHGWYTELRFKADAR
jgi:hypothetical protein